MIVISLLSHVYLAQYGQNFPRFSCFAVGQQISQQNMRNSEEIGHIVLETVR